MDAKLFGQALLKFGCGLVLVAALLFLPAWTLDYWQAWLLLGILFIPMFLAGLVMLAKNPELLRKRLQAREEEMEQKLVIALSGLMFLAAFVSPGRRRSSFCWPTPCTRRSCGKIPTSPAPSRCRRARRSSTPGSTASCATPCT